MEPQGVPSLPNLPQSHGPGADSSIPQSNPTAASHMPVSSTQQVGVSNTTPPPDGSLPAMANDVDLIETEWVDAAKRIIEENKTDPYAQSRAMTLLRADYMKKRYNKIIKVPEN